MMCESYDDDDSDFCSYSWRHARKEHNCCACDEIIRRGDRYHITALGNRGERPQGFKHCARCWLICEALWEANGGETINLRLDCGERWEEHFDPEDTPEPGDLAFLTPDEAQARIAKRKSADRITQGEA